MSHIHNIQEAEKHMKDSLDSLQKLLKNIRAGRAHPSLIDAIIVESYGQMVPITQIASVSAPDASTLVVQLWDGQMVKATEKAITNSNLGLTPNIDGQTIRINIPKLSQERRAEYCKIAKKYGEDYKIAIRNSRRDYLEALKKQEKDGDIGKDEAKSLADKAQKITDSHIKQIDEMVALREKEIMVA